MMQHIYGKIKAGNDQEKAQSERNSQSKNRVWKKKTKSINVLLILRKHIVSPFPIGGNSVSQTKLKICKRT